MSLSYVRDMLLKREPASLKICALLDKRGRRRVEVPLDYVGFNISDEYVVGYGLDYENKFRNLPYVATFRKST
jgi:hypoxanthine phosphoribosyltransferase